MSEEKNKVIEAIAETLSKATGDDNFVLPLAALQTKNAASAEINAAYSEEVKQYVKAPVLPCDKKNSLKLLRRFARKSFQDFWTAPVSEYLPAVSEGTMKLKETVYPHDKAISYAKGLIETLSPRELAKDFLYGVANNAPEYTTALACYYYVKNIPEHEFKKRYIGSTVDRNGKWVDVYSDSRCEICGYDQDLSNEAKMQFWHINVDMEFFYFKGQMERSCLNTAIIFLEEYKRLSAPKHSVTDLEHFMKIIDVIEKTPDNMTSGKLRKELKQSGLLKMTFDQIEVFINTLGYLDILHPEDSHGMLYVHTPQRAMLHPLSDRGYAEHPVNRWTGKCGIDRKSIFFLFDGIYD